MSPGFSFAPASERALDSRADLRWGRDRKGFPRFLHPNGICLTGRWEITEDTPYSGYFARDSTALVVARYSSGASGNQRGQIRSLALVCIKLLIRTINLRGPDRRS